MQFTKEELLESESYKGFIYDQNVEYIGDIFENSDLKYSTFLVITRVGQLFSLYRFFMVGGKIQCSVDKEKRPAKIIFKELADRIKDNLN